METLTNIFNDGSILYIAGGVIVTLQYSMIAVMLGMVIGILVAAANFTDSRFLKLITNSYVSVFRGTPLLIQLSIIYFGLPKILDIDISVFAAGIAAFSLNSGSYVSEHIRAGIESVDQGQLDAAKILRIPNYFVIKDIILPQAIRNILPSLINELINLIKESALISIIGGVDIMRRAQLVVAEQYDFFTPMLIAASCYFILVSGFTLLLKKLEQKIKI